MIPAAYEFHWDVGHIVFLGVFYGVVTVVAATLGTAIYHSVVDFRRRRVATIDWDETFHDLPESRRHCRHEYRGNVSRRLCDRGFACATCPQHQAFLELERKRGPASPSVSRTGLRLSEDRYYHRGHTWVERRADGTLDIGLDELATRCLGRPDEIELPGIGEELSDADAVATLIAGTSRTRVLAPVAGEVIAAGDLDRGWLCRVRPKEPDADLGQLLHGPEADVWMMRELEALRRLLSRDDTSHALADGGRPVDDLVQAYPAADWEGIRSHLYLET